MINPQIYQVCQSANGKSNNFVMLNPQIEKPSHFLKVLSGHLSWGARLRLILKKKFYFLLHVNVCTVHVHSIYTINCRLFNNANYEIGNLMVVKDRNTNGGGFLCEITMEVHER
jgi:hypothetical protein